MDFYRGQLPIPERKFEGKIGRTTEESKPDKPVIVTPPEGTPNVVVVLLDDVSFARRTFSVAPCPCPRCAR